MICFTVVTIVPLGVVFACFWGLLTLMIVWYLYWAMLYCFACLIYLILAAMLRVAEIEWLFTRCSCVVNWCIG